MIASNEDRTAATGAPGPAALRLRLRDGLTIIVPAKLSAITSYVLLEQEEWFEKEIHFLRRFLKPGMTAIDIGANLGVYSLPMASLVGPDGRVFSYEPGREARTMLDDSRILNNLDNLEIFGTAVSDGAREGYLGFASSSELRALGTEGGGEPVHITSLDLEDAARMWRSPDFIKIDAEGEEERIVAGGRAFFEKHSPLLMFEIKAGDKVNERLLEMVPAIGYRLFRLIEAAPILVPQETHQPLDRYELNLFAAKSDLVEALSKQGLLVATIPAWAPTDLDRKNALEFWRRQTYACSSVLSHLDGTSADADYLDGLTAYATWRNLNLPATTRIGALAVALKTLRAVCTRARTAERISTLARAAWEWGARGESVTALSQLLRMLDGAPISLREPFWPASPRFDNIAPQNQPAAWFTAAAAEQFERTIGFSSAFNASSPVLAWLCSQPLASTEMERRRILIAARAGLRPVVSERLRVSAPDHANADVWRAGLVPGTILAK